MGRQKIATSTLIALAGVLLLGCGEGVEEVRLIAPAGTHAFGESAQSAQPEQSKAFAPFTANDFLDEAERRFPDLFSGAATRVEEARYVARHYPATGNSLAVVLGGEVYLTGRVTTGDVRRVGYMSIYECAMVPQNCRPPTPPTDMTATPRTRAVWLSFGAASASTVMPVTSYMGECTDGTTTTYSLPSDIGPLAVQGLKNGVTYTCTVRAKGGRGIGDAAPAIQVRPEQGIDGEETGLPPLSVNVAGTPLTPIAALSADYGPMGFIGNDARPVCKPLSGFAALRTASLPASASFAIEAIALYRGEELVWAAPVTGSHLSDDGLAMHYVVRGCQPKDMFAATVTPVFTLSTPEGRKRVRGEPVVIGATY